MKTKIILGPPGTGKTHTLLNRVEEENQMELIQMTGGAQKLLKRK